MAIHKNKQQILDRDITKFSLMEGLYDYLHFYWDCDDDWGYYWDSYLDTQDWGYLPDTDERTHVITRRGMMIFGGTAPRLGRMIDMKTVWSKEILRDKKIDYLLGLEIKNPTFADIWKK